MIGYTDSAYAVASNEAISSWAVNLQTGAVSQYTDYPFTAYAHDGARSLATAEDGIYLLEGDDDNGTAIDALVDIGPQTFGTPYLKRLTFGYLGLANDGAMQLRHESDDGQVSTQTMTYTGPLQLRKLVLPRGQVGNYHRVILTNRCGAGFALDSIELVPEVLTRRGTGAHQ